MKSDIVDPINIGSSEMVTIDRLVDLVEEIAGIKVKRNYNLAAPKGVRGRSSDNTLIKSKLGWEPLTPLRTGLETTYAWIFDQMRNGEEGSVREVAMSTAALSAGSWHKGGIEEVE